MPSSVADILRGNPKPQFWSTHDVRRWLESIGMDVYAPIFEAAGVQVSRSTLNFINRRYDLGVLWYHIQILFVH